MILSLQFYGTLINPNLKEKNPLVRICITASLLAVNRHKKYERFC